MRLLLIFTSFFISTIIVKGQGTPIYSFEIESIKGDSKINFSSFIGKKILVFTTASQDSTFNQYEELIQLSEIYKEDLVIVVFPTNSFQSESESGSILNSKYATSLSTFFIASKTRIKEPNIHPLFYWLTNSSQNGRMNSSLNRPGFKFLINKSGELVGIFSPVVRPMSSIMLNSLISIN